MLRRTPLILLVIMTTTTTAAGDARTGTRQQAAATSGRHDDDFNYGRRQVVCYYFPQVGNGSPTETFEDLEEVQKCRIRKNLLVMPVLIRPCLAKMEESQAGSNNRIGV